MAGSDAERAVRVNQNIEPQQAEKALWNLAETPFTYMQVVMWSVVGVLKKAWWSDAHANDKQIGKRATALTRRSQAGGSWRRPPQSSL